MDETTICRVLMRIAQLAERVLKVKQKKLLSENDLQLSIVDATKSRIERPKNQRAYAARYRGPLDNNAQIFQTITGIYNLSFVG
jgi:hypothetical protein